MGHARARSTDNAASHEAAERIEASGIAATQRELCLDAVRRYPGITSKELSARTGLDRHMMARRLPELLERGYVDRDETCHGYLWFPRRAA